MFGRVEEAILIVKGRFMMHSSGLNTRFDDPSAERGGVALPCVFSIIDEHIDGLMLKMVDELTYGSVGVCRYRYENLGELGFRYGEKTQERRVASQLLFG